MAEKKKKHLHELLEDDQEPFQLNHYIANLRSQMGFSDFRLKKRSSGNNPHGVFSCESSCFLAMTHKSPDSRNSPLFELLSPAKKTLRDGRVFLQVPAITTAILMEAAARIKTTNKAGFGTVAEIRHGFGMFGSVLKRLRNRKPKPRRGNDDTNAISLERGSDPTSSSSQQECFVEIGDKYFCESPFHFVLQTTPSSSSGQQTLQFTSTATSPTRRSTEDEDSDETEHLEKVRGHEDEAKEEEDKEQCSPVSVLDPLEEDHHQQHEPDHLSLHSCSFVVQRAKRRLLKKLRRFEKLAGLDPAELEGKMSEEEEENEESEEDDNIRLYDSVEEYENMYEAEEERSRKNDERKKKWRMMKAWKLGSRVEEDVNVMVQKGIMREEAGEWTRHGEEVEEAVSDLELSIFFFLIDEFSHELVRS